MRNRCLSILIYHRVLDKPDPLRENEVDIVRFSRQMDWIKRYFNVIDLSSAIKLMKENKLPRRALSITFDDGYKDNYFNALPILKNNGFTATFFISTGFLNGGIMWNDIVIEALRDTKKQKLDLTEFGLNMYTINNKLRTLTTLLSEIKYLPFSTRTELIKAIPEKLAVSSPQNLMMTDAEVIEMKIQGMAIGGHTKNHPILSRLDVDIAKTEMLSGKQYLEKLIDKRLKVFAYPNGKAGQDYGSEHVALARSIGFDAAVSTDWGVTTTSTDVFQLPRFTPWDKNNFKFFLRLIKMRILR